MKARAVAGKMEDGLLNDPVSELLLGKEKGNEKSEDNRKDEQKQTRFQPEDLVPATLEKCAITVCMTPARE